MIEKGRHQNIERFGCAWEADAIGNSAQDCFMQELHSHIDDSPKALYYKHFKSSLKALLEYRSSLYVQENLIKFSMFKSLFNDRERETPKY